MTSLSTKYDKHILICTKEREEGHPRGSCLTADSLNIRNQLVKLINQHGLKGKVRATKSGCIDCCEVGPVLVIYPQNIWYVGVNQKDVEEIFTKSILNNHIIKRLVANKDTWEKWAFLRKTSTLQSQKSQPNK